MITVTGQRSKSLVRWGILAIFMLVSTALLSGCGKIIPPDQYTSITVEIQVEAAKLVSAPPEELAQCAPKILAKYGYTQADYSRSREAIQKNPAMRDRVKAAIDQGYAAATQAPATSTPSSAPAPTPKPPTK